MVKLLSVVVLTVLFTTHLYSQGRIISGKVLSKDDQSSLPGTSVSVEGENTGTATDSAGTYSISVGENATALLFSSVGYKSQRIPIGVSTTIDVFLENEGDALEEVVVTANAVEKQRRSLGYAITTVTSKELTQGNDRSFLNAMQGKVAGALIQNASGSPGSSTRIVLRGGTSLLNNNQALFVVDGIPIDNTQAGTGTSAGLTDNLNNSVDVGNRGNDINPEDIESVNILKGPAAAALYGSRAANGALIITTKSGKGIADRKARLNYSTSYTFQNILKLPDFQNEFGQGGEGKADLRENFSWGPRFDGIMRPWGRVVDGEQKIKPYAAIPDNVKNFFNTGNTFTNNVSLTGGGTKATYYASFSNVHQNGVVPNTNYDRTSLRFTGTAQLTDKFFSSASVNYIKTKGSFAVAGQRNSFYDEVIQTPRDIPLSELKDYQGKFNNLNSYYSPYTTNPYWYLNEDSFNNNVDRMIGNIQLSYKLNSWINATYRIGTDFYTDRRTQVTAIRKVTDEQNAQFSTPNPGRFEVTDIYTRELTSDLMISGKRNITEKLGVNLLLGYNVRQRNSSAEMSTANELVTPGFYNLRNINGSPSVINTTSIRRLYGFYADLTFSYANYLFLEFTGRNDFSSTLPKNNNSFFYPSANASFVFTDALKINSNYLTYGKIRANIAQVGNDAGPYLLTTTYDKATINDGFSNTDLTFPINNVPAFSKRDLLGNNQISPEITSSYEIGGDLYFFRDRIGIEATYYSTRSNKQILQIPLAASTGYTAKVLNAGVLTNHGIEMLLRLTPVLLKNGFRWRIDFNYTKNNSLVKDLPAGLEQVQIGTAVNGATLVAAKGQPYGSFYANTELRDPQGRIVVDNETGLPLLDPNSQIVGNIQPDFFAGIYNTFSYKGLSLSILFDWKQGGKIYSRTKDLTEFVGTASNTTFNNREDFVIPNTVTYDEASDSYTPNKTKVSAQDYWTDQTIDSRNIIDASYVKLRELSLSYTLPESLLNKTFISGITIGISGRNLLIWTPAENKFVDPEISSFGGASPTSSSATQNNTQGFDYGAIPPLRSYGANLRITF